ncbi:hypothetical protein IG193_07480 [Infirmifilum lucidum]|uniref:DUF4443 domain-containing protein n=1 Tax=Infirmifilum lucidum TaxID=2776706 RepID=A0A7L9FFM4_9CREN|nr:DUF4443 domain-containing protein [Infirmifilum lucidum]QOJ78590.1 hypothetical protein IG193_07480 [Infirmifilum lucidum]
MSTGNSREYLLVLFFLYFTPSFVGRFRISSELRIGEGRVRRILSELLKTGLIVRKRAGVKISARGRREVEHALLRKGINELFLSDATELNAAVVVVGIARSVQASKINVLGLRDDAVRGGALGAIISVYRGGSLKLPPADVDLCEYASNLCREITRRKSLEENALIIATFGDKLVDALSGFISLLEGRYYGELSQDSITWGTSRTDST